MADDTTETVVRGSDTHDAFVSYSRADREAVERLATAMLARGRQLWVDWEGIPPSAEWMVEIREAIDAADAVVFVLSPSSLGSPVCGEELAHAEAAHKRIIPLLVRDVDPALVPAALAERNWLFLRPDDDAAQVAETLTTVLDVDLEAVKKHTRLTLRATEWDLHHRDSAWLLRGSDLDEAERYLGSMAGGPPPTPAQTRYVVASRQAAGRRQRVVVAAVSTALVVAIVLSAFALVQRSEAVRQRDLARTQALASAALAALDRDPEESLLLALAAAGTGRTPLVLNALRRSVLASHVERTLRPGAPGESLGDLTFSPAGDALYLGRNSPPRLVGYDLRNGHKSFTVDALSGGFPFLQGVAVLGQQLAVVTDRLQLIDPRTRRVTPIAEDVAPALPYYAVTSAPDGASVFTTSLEGVVRQVSADGRLVRTFGGGHGELYDATPSPDGRSLAVSGVDGIVRVYDITTGRTRTRLRVGSAGAVARWSPSGEQLLTTSQDRLARVWDVQNRTVVQVLGHSGLLNDATWIGNAYVATADSQGVGRVWSVATGEILSELRGHTAWISYLAASGDGRRLATTSEDGTARVWRLGSNAPSVRFAAPGIVTGVDVSADGTKLIWASHGQGTAVADTRTGRGPRVLDPEGSEAPRLSPDGTAVAVLVNEGDRPAVRLRDVGSGALRWEQYDLGTVPGQARFDDPPGTPPSDRPAAPRAAAFSPDGSRIAVVTELGVRVLDATNGRVLVTYAGRPWTRSSRTSLATFGHEGGVAWTPDSGRIVLGDGRDVLVLNSATGVEVSRFSGHEDQVSAVAVSADGSRVVSASLDQTARIWTARGKLLRVLPLQARGAGVAMSRHGFVATVAGDGNLRVWSPSGTQVMRTRIATTIADAVQFTSDSRRVVVGTGEGFDERVGLQSSGGLRQSGAASVVNCEVCRDYTHLRTYGRTRVTRSLPDDVLAAALGRRVSAGAGPVALSTGSNALGRTRLATALVGRWRADVSGDPADPENGDLVGPLLLRFQPDGSGWLWQDVPGLEELRLRTGGGMLEVTSESCGDVRGRYSFSVEGEQVRLTPVDDECDRRRVRLDAMLKPAD